MRKFGVSILKRIPFLRILIPLIAGIILQYHLQGSSTLVITLLAAGVLLFISSAFLSTPKLFLLRWLAGIGVTLLFFALGAIIADVKNIEHDENWIGKHYNKCDAIIVSIQEPLVEKPKSYKAQAKIEAVIRNDSVISTQGNILLYFRKTAGRPSVDYGTRVLIGKTLQPITNSGNPGGFDYKQYCAFRDIHFQVFLEEGEYNLFTGKKSAWFKQLLIDTRSWVLGVLRKHIKSKNEVAVAEALLIGYRDDLDRELVQSYSNAGVVHIIAISGLHLGMIYVALVWLFGKTRNGRWKAVMQPLVIILILWMFTFIAGAVPSILRSAIMFTCIVLAETIRKRTSIYNTLAVAAFLMLLINPYYLWDAGFQLSFAAVLSIVIFQRPIVNWFYVQNPVLLKIWRLTSVTLAAQVLTLPVVLYHFHQFPNLFLFTNLLIIPLSGLILFAELLLLAFTFIPVVGKGLGIAVEWLIWLMNSFIERTDRLPFAVTDGIQIDIPQAIFIYGIIAFAFVWLMKKSKQMLFAATFSLLGYIALRSYDLIKAHQQQKLIVYNVPQHTAIDIIEGGHYRFYGDTALLGDGFLRNFHLRPSRIVNRISSGVLSHIIVKDHLIASAGKKVIIIDAPLPVENPSKKITADVLIITKNPRLYIGQLIERYDCKLVVFDATNTPWKIRLWKKDCDSLHLRHHSVPEQGAFEMNL